MADRIHPTAIIDKGASIADDVTIGCYSFIGADVTLNEGCVLHSHVVIDGRTTLGKNNEVYPFAVLGKAPQHIKYEGEPSMLEIGDNNVIRESVTIHRGTAVGTMKTVIGDNNNFFAGVHIAHDCIIANNTIFVNDSMAGGHAEVDDFAYISSNSGIRQFVRIGKYAMVAPTAAITSDVIPFGFAFGVKPALSGLNLIGLRRRGFSKEQIDTLRRAYRLLFASEGIFKDRLKEAEVLYGKDENVASILAFIKAGGDKPLCHPDRNG